VRAMICTAFARRLRWAIYISSVLNLALLVGCEGGTLAFCDGPTEMFLLDKSAESAASAAHQRAGAAIACDASQITGRISMLGVPEPDSTLLRDRTRELAKLALDTMRASPVESSRLPLSLAHQQMFEVAAEAERAIGAASIAAWVTNPWQAFHPLDRPAADAKSMLSTALMRGERRALALNIRSTSVTYTNVRIEVSLAGLRYDTLHIYQVNWTGNDLSAWAAAELQLLGDASRAQDVSMLPGVTRQIWIEVRPDAATAAGRYVGDISLMTPDGQSTHIPIEITVFRPELPLPSMHFGGWDYSSSVGRYAPEDANRSQFIEYLQARNVDTPWAHNDVMNWKHLGPGGVINGPVDASALERWLSAWPNARRFRIYLEVEDYIAGIPADDNRFVNVVTEWADTWAAQIRRLNRSPDQFDLLLVDEPKTPEQIRTTQLWAQGIRAAGAGYRIWTDLMVHDASLMQSLLDVSDTVAVNLAIAESENFSPPSKRGKELEVYAFDGPARRMDPYAYYRLAPWRAFFMGATAVTFWSFADTGGVPSDNEFAATKRDYSPLFITDEHVRPGKHMEAAAEGIQDTQYLEMLKQVATTHPIESVRLQAQELLNQAATFLSESPRSSGSQWELKGVVGGADEQRMRIGEFLDLFFGI
jgi:hypothetical protein